MTTPTVHINAAGATLWVRKQDGHMREFNNASASTLRAELWVQRNSTFRGVVSVVMASFSSRLIWRSSGCSKRLSLARTHGPLGWLEHSMKLWPAQPSRQRGLSSRLVWLQQVQLGRNRRRLRRAFRFR